MGSIIHSFSNYENLLRLCLLITAFCTRCADEPPEPLTIVMVHGATAGAWEWQTTARFLEDDGRDVHRVTLTGLGDHRHLACAEVDLDTHIDDVATTPTMIPNIGGIDGKWHQFYVANATIRHAVSDHIATGYETTPGRIDPNTVSTEAPNVFKRLGTDTYVLMYDVYGGRPNNMGFSETTDFVTYTDLGRFNEGVMRGTNFNRPKHGAVTHATRDELQRVAEHWNVEIDWE